MVSVLDDDAGNSILYVGSDKDDVEAQRRGYAVLVIAKDGPYGHRSMLGYHSLAAPKDKNYYFVERGNRMALNILDLDDPEWIPDEAINAGFDFLDRHLKAGDRVLVHCNAGHSRGPTMAMMYLRRVGELPHTFRGGYRVFHTLYSEFDPGVAMYKYARKRWDSLPLVEKK
jgi:hypothetical protein